MIPAGAPQADTGGGAERRRTCLVIIRDRRLACSVAITLEGSLASPGNRFAALVPPLRGRDFTAPADRSRAGQWAAARMPAGERPMLVAFFEDGLVEDLSDIGWPAFVAVRPGWPVRPVAAAGTVLISAATGRQFVEAIIRHTVPAAAAMARPERGGKAPSVHRARVSRPVAVTMIGAAGFAAGAVPVAGAWPATHPGSPPRTSAQSQAALLQPGHGAAFADRKSAVPAVLDSAVEPAPSFQAASGQGNGGQGNGGGGTGEQVGETLGTAIGGGAGGFIGTQAGGFLGGVAGTLIGGPVGMPFGEAAGVFAGGTAGTFGGAYLGYEAGKYLGELYDQMTQGGTSGSSTTTTGLNPQGTPPVQPTVPGQTGVSAGVGAGAFATMSPSPTTPGGGTGAGTGATATDTTGLPPLDGSVPSALGAPTLAGSPYGPADSPPGGGIGGDPAVVPGGNDMIGIGDGTGGGPGPGGGALAGTGGPAFTAPPAQAGPLDGGAAGGPTGLPPLDGSVPSALGAPTAAGTAYTAPPVGSTGGGTTSVAAPATPAPSGGSGGGGSGGGGSGGSGSGGGGSLNA